MAVLASKISPGCKFCIPAVMTGQGRGQAVQSESIRTCPPIPRPVTVPSHGPGCGGGGPAGAAPGRGCPAATSAGLVLCDSCETYDDGMLALTDALAH